MDIGGGGEGVISKLQDNKVISIGKVEKELIEAQKSTLNSLNILMDATNLNFLEESFEVVTSFFTLMCIPTEDREEVLSKMWIS
ncbi:MAG: SAM-dependent methyltransferase [Candidatus Methanohalarchaeum thermophilum]|uniref:SAM-dependent methyltransferase n=1 Tax=Methanohalarchaeum thermophilum TaxID=1903181 RepID=A0A1Q6DVV7_METT1|nr:MAG: SAM-dependent methyltransferase [Candidatus Methanohalarchaeum thermophilum]